MAFKPSDKTVNLILEHLATHGPNAPAPHLTETLMKEGASRTTAFRHFKKMRDEFDPAKAAAALRERIESQPRAARIKEEIDEKRARQAAERMAKARATVDIGTGSIIPPVPPDHFETFISPAALFSVSERLEGCIKLGQELIDHARGPDGKLRNTRLALAASEHLRRAVETQARVTLSLLDLIEAEKLMRDIILILKEETPRAAEKALLRIEALRSQ